MELGPENDKFVKHNLKSCFTENSVKNVFNLCFTNFVFVKHVLGRVSPELALELYFTNKFASHVSKNATARLHPHRADCSITLDLLQKHTRFTMIELYGLVQRRKMSMNGK